MKKGRNISVIPRLYLCGNKKKQIYDKFYF